MVDFPNYSDCRVIIQDLESNQTVADTHILESDPISYSITVPRNAFADTPPVYVSLLIPAYDILREYRGSIRRDSITPRTVDIALYKGRQRENRTFTRYGLNTTVQLSLLQDSLQQESLPSPMDAVLINISRQGCLLRTDKPFANIGAILQFSVSQGDSMLPLRATVVRAQMGQGTAIHYGCRFC